MPFELPQLPYGTADLEPYIDEETMRVHYGKHHQGYVDKLNAALEQYPDLQNASLKDLLSRLDDIPENIRASVRNNGGGHSNHSLFWAIMSPQGGGEPEGALALALSESFGGFALFREAFTKAALSVFGSGWAWLAADKRGALFIVTTPNQDTPLSQGALPILGLDVWEHAYYLRYQNRRPEYVEAWWNVVNWKRVEENLKHAA